MLTLREERPEDATGVRKVNELAFNRSGEADLVVKLNKSGKCFVSIVAELDGEIVGHVYYSPMRIDTNDGMTEAVGLGPVAVLPTLQRQGIGSSLIRYGVEECIRRGVKIIFVLGSPKYYPRFGFKPAHLFGLRCKYPVPEDVFMVMELRAGVLQGIGGLALYQPEFDEV